MKNEIECRFRVQMREKWAIVPFLDVQKSQEKQASKKFYNKCSENSISQIVFPKTEVQFSVNEEFRRKYSKRYSKKRKLGNF